ncbi:MAG: ATP-binding protein [Armatimonadota bacterium]
MKPLKSHVTNLPRPASRRTGRLMNRLLILFGALVAIPLCIAGVLLSWSGRNSIQSSGTAISQTGGEVFSRSADGLIEMATTSFRASGRRMAAISRRQVLELGDKQGKASEEALRKSGLRLIEEGSETLRRSTDRLVDYNSKILAGSNARLQSLHEEAVQQVTNTLISEARSALERSGSRFAELNSGAVRSLASQMSIERARRIAEKVDQQMRQLTADVVAEAQKPAFTDFSREAAELALWNMVLSNPNVLAVTLYGPRGRQISSVSRGIPFPPHSGPEPPGMPEGPASLSRVMLDPDRREPSIMITVPIESLGSGPGSLVAWISLSSLTSLVQQTYQGQTAGAIAYLVATDGTVLAHPDRQWIGLRMPEAHRQVLDAAAEQDSGSVELGDKDSDRTVYAFAHVGDRPWIVVAIQPLREVLTIAEQIKSTIDETWRQAANQMEQKAQAKAAEVLGAAVPQQKKVAAEAASAVRAEGQRMVAQATRRLSAEQTRVIAEAVRDARRMARDQASAAAATIQSNTARATERAAVALRTEALRSTAAGREQMRRISIVESQRAARKMLLQSAWMVALFVACALALAAVTASSIVRPVRRLAECTQALAHGDFSKQADISTNDELEQLAKAFNQMASGIQQAQDELRHTNERLAQEKRLIEAIVESSPDGLILMDPDGEMVFVNPAARKLLGWSNAPVEGQAALSLPPAVAGMRDETPEPKDVTLEGPSTRVVQVRSVAVRDDQGTAWARLVHLHDVTREREIDEMKNNFVSLVSHELRTPLTSILGFSSYMLTGKMGPLTDVQQTAVESMYRQAKRLRAIISDFLDLSRMESGGIRVRFDVVPLAEIALRVIEEMRPQAEEKQVSLSMSADTNPAVTAVGDEERIAQVFTNLLANAIKFTPSGGRVEVSVRTRNGFAEASVTDTGVGIPETELPRIFDRFYQVERAVTRKTGGTGLGLAIVKNIVEAHGGTISVTSAVGRGSTFTFSLPTPKHSHPYNAAGDPADVQT